MIKATDNWFRLLKGIPLNEQKVDTEQLIQTFKTIYKKKTGNDYEDEAYLKQYAEHYALVEKELPRNRLLILRTDEVSSESHQIAGFLNINANKLITERSNSEPNKAAFIDQLDEQFIIRSLWEHCAPIIEQFFPERLPYYQKHIGINN